MKKVYLVEDLKDPDTPFVYFNIDEFTGESFDERYGRVMIVEFTPTHTIDKPVMPTWGLRPIASVAAPTPTVRAKKGTSTGRTRSGNVRRSR